MRWRRFFQRRQSDAELQQEMELHMEEEIAENIERGMAKDEARRGHSGGVRLADG